MGILKRIKGSYVFTQLEVGKYTRRRGAARRSDSGAETPRTAPDFVSEFDRAAEEELYEAQLAAAEDERRQRAPRTAETSCSAETLAGRPATQVRSSVDLTAAQRERLGGLTAVSTPLSSPRPSLQPASGDAAVFDTARPRPHAARAARSTVDMQSVYFAPGHNVTLTNRQQQKQQQMADGWAPSSSVSAIDRSSASSTDYYLFSPSPRETSHAPLTARRQQLRGVVRADTLAGADLHRQCLDEPAAPPRSSTNPFAARRRGAARPPPHAGLFDDGADDLDPYHSRRYLNTPVYADIHGSDLLA
ncbi:hypothetical protein H4R21_001075 [Coemansia helicoidea]|uniref:Uncharacterized protein n=1 Tax=Coemansia helicoidea TaxID=1286919 RepID=A0ACC1LEF5_9FUNG|nr:hypothetical protein H4R21_001075 [Coemansia helicoidea]